MARDIKQRVTVEDRGSQKLNRAAQSVTRYGRTWQRTARVTNRAMRLMDRGFLRLGRSMRNLTRRAKFMLIGFQLTATIMAGSMVRSAMKYEQALRNVTSLMAGAGMGQEQLEKNFKRMDGAIRRLAVRFKQTPVDLAEGMYQIVSATFDGESGMRVLEAAAKGAQAGMSDTNAVAGLLTKTLQAYRKEGQSSAEVSRQSTDVLDTMFMAVNRGMFTFDELSNKLGALPATAAAFGVNLQDMMAALSTATIRGMSLDEAITGVRQTLLQIVSDSPQIEKAAEKAFGADYKNVWSAGALAENGLFGTMQQLQSVLPDISDNMLSVAQGIENDGGDAMGFLAQQTGMAVETISSLFPNIRALKAVLALSGPGMSLYAENMGFMEERAGATERALGEMEKTTALTMEKFKAMVGVIGLDFGGLILPVLNQAGNGMLDWYGDIQMKFAREGGLFEDDAWLGGVGDSEAEARMQTAANEFWDNATPGERLSYTLRTAWSDAITNLTEWFNNGGGKQKLEALGEKFGDIIAGGIKAISGVGSDDITGSLPAQFGKALVDGFLKAFEDVDWGAFFSSTIGTALSAIIGGIFGGPGGAIGAGLGANSGMNPLITGAAGMAVWKLLPKLIPAMLPAAAAGGGSAAAGGAGAATIGAMTIGGVSAMSILGTVALTGAAAYAFAKGFDWLLKDMWERGNEDPLVAGGSSELSAWRAAEAQAKVDAGMDPFQAINEATKYSSGGTGAYGMGLPSFPSAAGLDFGNMFDGKVWDDASGGFVDAAQEQTQAGGKQTVAANRMDRAVARFGTEVARLGGISLVSGILSHDNTGSGTTKTTAGGHTASKRGYDGMVYSPKKFLAGEAGPERVTITPGGGGGVGGGSPITVHVHDSGNPKATAAAVVRELEKVTKNG